VLGACIGLDDHGQVAPAHELTDARADARAEQGVFSAVWSEVKNAGAKKISISTSGGAETSGVVASGISQALVTTQTGLTIALPALFLVSVIRRQRRALEAHIARLESLTLGYMKLD